MARTTTATYNEHGYEVTTQDSEEETVTDYYAAGNHPLESTSHLPPGENSLPLATIRKYAERTGKEQAEEHGATWLGAEYDPSFQPNWL
jgi:hypothetical protein